MSAVHPNGDWREPTDWMDNRPDPSAPIPVGLCQCGCGERTPVALSTSHKWGHVAGQPRKYMPGHSNRRIPPLPTLNRETGCWEWRGVKSRSGYPRLGARPAHHVYYERARGPVPAGLTLDHLCRNRGCVNPDHLEPVTLLENVRRRPDLKLDAQRAAFIRLMYRAGFNQKELAQIFGVHQSSISAVCMNQLWRETA